MPDSATPWTAAHQALLSMRFSRQGYCSGLPFPSPGDLPDPGIKPGSPALQADSLLTELQGEPNSTLKYLKKFKEYCVNANQGISCLKHYFESEKRHVNYIYVC